MTIRLLLADDHQLLRDTLSTFLAQQEDLEVITVGDILEAQEVLARSEPFDLVILDYGMPGMQGLDGLQAILGMETPPATALISGFASRDVVTRAVQMGIRGFLHKSMPAKSLLNAIRFMALGERYVPVDFMTEHAALAIEENAFARAPGPTHLAESLTVREKEVLEALCLGRTNKEIARDLRLSEPTIKLHVKTLYRRLGVSNRTQAAMVARSQGLC